VCHGSDARAQFYEDKNNMYNIYYILITYIGSRTTETNSFSLAEGSLSYSQNSVSKPADSTERIYHQLREYVSCEPLVTKARRVAWSGSLGS
jgi:hypothetical protein